MKLSTVASVSSIFVASAHAANSEQVAFLTALVEDFKDHKGDYLKFYQTASDVPGVLTSLVKQVGTYKDDSYTTLLDDSAINVGSLSSFATNLPWYTRIASEIFKSRIFFGFKNFFRVVVDFRRRRQDGASCGCYCWSCSCSFDVIY